jgi:hypothetical protein
LAARPRAIHAFSVYLFLRFSTSQRLSSRALSLRLWRIVAGVAAVIALNYGSLWLERQPGSSN